MSRERVIEAALKDDSSSLAAKAAGHSLNLQLLHVGLNAPLSNFNRNEPTVFPGLFRHPGINRPDCFSITFYLPLTSLI